MRFTVEAAVHGTPASHCFIISACCHIPTPVRALYLLVTVPRCAGQTSLTPAVLSARQLAPVDRVRKSPGLDTATNPATGECGKDCFASSLSARSVDRAWKDAQLTKTLVLALIDVQINPFLFTLATVTGFLLPGRLVRYRT